MLITLRGQRVEVFTCSNYTQKEPLLMFFINQVFFFFRQKRMLKVLLWYRINAEAKTSIETMVTSRTFTSKFFDVTSVNIILSLRSVHPCKQHAVHCWNQ